MIPQSVQTIIIYSIAYVVVNLKGIVTGCEAYTFSDPNLLVVKDASVKCPFSIDRCDVAELIKDCGSGKVNMFEYNSKYSRVCKDMDMYNMAPLGESLGSYVVVNKKMFEQVSDDVEFKVDFECAGDVIEKESNSLYDLLEKATEMGDWVSINPVGTSFKAKYCWTLKKKIKKENNILLGRLKKLEPRPVKYRTVQCHTNGSIQPDNYSSIFYPGDVIPAKLANKLH